MNSKGFGSLLVSGGLLRKIGKQKTTNPGLGALKSRSRGFKIEVWRAPGASWGVLGGKTVLEPSWSRFGAVLEASWRRLGDVLGRLGSVLGASCGPLGGFLGRLVGLLGRLGASWRHLVLDFHTKRWLHVSLASEMPFFIGFLPKFASNFDTRKPTKR